MFMSSELIGRAGKAADKEKLRRQAGYARHAGVLRTAVEVLLEAAEWGGNVSLEAVWEAIDNAVGSRARLRAAVVQQSPGGVGLVRAAVDDHVVNRSILDRARPPPPPVNGLAGKTWKHERRRPARPRASEKHDVWPAARVSDAIVGAAEIIGQLLEAAPAARWRVCPGPPRTPAPRPGCGPAVSGGLARSGAADRGRPRPRGSVRHRLHRDRPGAPAAPVLAGTRRVLGGAQHGPRQAGVRSTLPRPGSTERHASNSAGANNCGALTQAP